MNTALIVALAAALQQGPDWPNFRGSNHNGWVEGSVEWSAIGKAEPLWSVNVGKGYSSPSVSGDHLVTLGFDEAAGSDHITCLDRKTGEPRWRHTFAAVDKPQFHGGGTLSTPTIAGERVYCLNRDGVFHAISLASGEVIWKRSYLAELGVERTFHGVSASPLVDGKQIYLQFGGLVAAVSASDGSVLWKTTDEGDGSHANLLPLAARGEPALATIVGETFVVIRARDGHRQHSYSWKLRGNAMHCSMPVLIGDNRVFLSTAYNKGCALLQIGETSEPTLLWANRRMRNKVTASVPYKGHLYGFDESMLRCIDLDGNAKWRVRGLGLGSLSIVDDRMLILTSDGELIIAEATPQAFRELSRSKVLDGGVYWTAPVFVGGLIYVRNSLGDMRCLDHRKVAAVRSPVAGELAGSTPLARSLFANHAKQVGGPEAFDKEGQDLQIRGLWSMPARGYNNAEMTWTLASAGRWNQRVDGELLYTFDGNRAWMIESQKPRLIVGDELFEHRHLFARRSLFAPTCPEDAKTAERPVRFAETPCWLVESTLPDHSGGKAVSVKHYFAIETGRLVGREGAKQSTITLRGSQHLNGLTLPKTVTRFSASDGQEHVMTLQTAKWIASPPNLFAYPRLIKRLLRTPEELAQANAALTKRFGKSFARYQSRTKDTVFRDDVFKLFVRDGELWCADPYSDLCVDLMSEEDGVYELLGAKMHLEIMNDTNGDPIAIKLKLHDEPPVLLHRLPK